MEEEEGERGKPRGGDPADARVAVEGEVNTEQYAGFFQLTAFRFPLVPPLAEPRQGLGPAVCSPGPAGQSRRGQGGRLWRPGVDMAALEPAQLYQTKGCTCREQ